MQNLKNVYRRYALSFATGSIAVCIGFVMQSSEAAVLSAEDIGAMKSADTSFGEPDLAAVSELSAKAALPSMPQELNVGFALPDSPVLLAVAKDTPVGILPAEETAPQLGCVSEMSASPAAGALVALKIHSACRADERVKIQHADLMFDARFSSQGTLDMMVPALTERAEFKTYFEDGNHLVANAQVDSLSFYDRVVIQWSGIDGPELHAREFGADYGSDGHVWREAARSVGALVGGKGGFLLHLGEDMASGQANKAEIYTFPSGISNQLGDVAISVEAEVTSTNCGRELAVQSRALRQGVLSDQHTVEMQMPDCSAVGEFLVLKNLVEDLTIAQN